METTTVCIAGGGPAGMMAGLLLARQDVDVIVLEKHPDFLRDFRGDTIHPATLSAVVGVRASTPEGRLEVRAQLVVGADGRHSSVRHRAGLDVIAQSPPMDALWLRLSRRGDDQVPFFRKQRNRVLVSINRGAYWQLAYIIPHQGLGALWQAGLEALRAEIAAVAPALADRVGEIGDWEDVKLLTVRVDRLRQWYRPGLLCIGDAAHAMSPAGGVGINLAIQDAVAAANILGPTFRWGGPSLRDLRRVQRRRELPTRIMQAFQVKVLRELYPKEIGDSPRELPDRSPRALQLVRWVPAVRHIAGWFIGRGIRAEHIRPVAV